MVKVREPTLLLLSIALFPSRHRALCITYPAPNFGRCLQEHEKSSP